MAHSIKSSWSFQAYDATQRNKKNRAHTHKRTQSLTLSFTSLQKKCFVIYYFGNL